MKKLTTEEFIAKAKLIHGDKYDYRLVEYVNNRLKIKIICPIHGEYHQTPNHHLKSGGCCKCGHDNKKLTTEEFIAKAKLVHGSKYDYSLVEYGDTKIKLICPIHGIFYQNPSYHLQGQGCIGCANMKKGLSRRSTTNEFVIQSNKIHNNKFSYPDEYTTANIKIKIVCPKHGEFFQRPTHHLKGAGCPFCKSSKGELRIKRFLENNKIKFTPQKTFDDCRGRQKKLPFDFFLIDYNVCIEYQGKQHFTGWNNKLDSLKEISNRDKLKKDYCILKGIRLLEITYKDDPIKVLKEFLCENSPNPLSAKDLLDLA